MLEEWYKTKSPAYHSRTFRLLLRKNLFGQMEEWFSEYDVGLLRIWIMDGQEMV